MLKGLFFTLLLYSSTLHAQSSALHQVERVLTVESSSSGETLQLGHDTYLKAIYDAQDLEGWALNVQIVDEEGSPITDEIYRTSRKYFNRAVAVSFSDPIEVLDEHNETKRVPAGVKLVRVSDVNEGAWKHYRLVMVNDQGEMVDWQGNVSSSPPVLKTSMINYDNANRNTHLQAVIRSLVNEKDMVEDSGPLVALTPHCVGCEEEKVEEQSPLILESSLRPVARPWGDQGRGIWPGPGTPHELVMARRASLKGKSSCERKRREYENELLNRTSWGPLSVTERAQKIRETAQESLAAMKEVSNDRRGSNNYADSVNPNYVSPALTSDMVTCIAFQETSGQLNPFMHNYTYCNSTRNMISTAHGLGQMTRGTFRKMKNHPEGDQLPYTTKYSQILRGKSDREAHEFLSTDPHLQLEVSLRLLNFELKFAKWKNRNATNDELTKMAITQYDHDNQSKYVKNVFDQCIPCLKRKSAGECYNEIWN